MGDSNRIRFACPHCRKRLGAEATAAGKRVRCPGCSKPVAIPYPVEDDDEPTEPAAPRRRWPWFAAGGGVILLAAVGIALWFADGGKRPPDPPGGPDVAAGPPKSAGPPAVAAESSTPKGAATEPVRESGLPRPRVGDWFITRSTHNGEKMPPEKVTVAAVDEKNVTYETERVNKGKAVRDTFKFPLADLGKSPFEITNFGEKELLGAGAETVQVGGRSIECKWVHYKVAEKGDPQKYTINGVSYGETIVTTRKVWYSPQVPLPSGVRQEFKVSHEIPAAARKYWKPDPDYVSLTEVSDFGSQGETPREQTKD